MVHTCSRRTQIWEAELLLTLSQSGRTATPLKEASNIAFEPFSSFTCGVVDRVSLFRPNQTVICGLSCGGGGGGVKPSCFTSCMCEYEPFFAVFLSLLFEELVQDFNSARYAVSVPNKRWHQLLQTTVVRDPLPQASHHHTDVVEGRPAYHLRRGANSGPEEAAHLQARPVEEHQIARV